MTEDLLHFDDFVLDRGAFELRRSGKVVTLQRIPLELLSLLVERRGQVVTREEIIRRVWGKGVFVDTESGINTAIRKLRRALHDDPEAPRFVATVPNRGYRFIAEIRAPKTSGAGLIPVRSSPLMIGRERELALLLGGLDDAAAGRGRLFLISGEPGVGKTRLADEVAAAAANPRGMSLLVGHCSEHEEAVAYLPFVEILEKFIDRAPDTKSLRSALGEQGPELSRLLPKLRNMLPELPPPLDLPPAQARRHLFNSFCDFAARLAAEQPTLLVLEDLHWADDATLSLLDHLTQRLSDLPLMVIGTYRDAELNVTRQLATALEELLRGRLATQVRLKGLPRDEVAVMLQSLSGKSPPDVVVGEIFAETGGNPFFVEELFRHLGEEGQLYDSTGQFRAELRIGELRAPPSVRLVVARRLARLNDLTRKMLATAAVIGRFFSFEILQAASRADANSLLERVEEAEKAGVVFSVAESLKARFEFAHELVRQAVLADLSAARRQRLHLEVGDAIERTYSNASESKYGGSLDDHLADLAYHYARSGNARQAVKYLHLAGQQAARRWAHLEAIDYLKKGLELLGSPPDAAEQSRPSNEAQRCSMLLLLGRAQWHAGEFLAAHQTLLSAGAIAKSLGSTASLVSAALELVDAMYFGDLPPLPAVRLLEEALQRLGAEDNPVTAKILSCLARAFGVAGAQQRATAYARQAVTMARRLDDPGLVAHSLYGMFFALLGPEHAAQRLSIAKEIVDLARAGNDTALLMDAQAHWWWAYCLLESGDMVAADAEFENHARVSGERNQPFSLSLNAMFRAMRALMQGRLEESEHQAQQAFQIGQRLQTETTDGVFGLQMFALRREQGRLKEVEPVVRMFVQQNTAAAAWRPGLALIYSELGLTTDARSEFEALAQHDFADLPRDPMWMGTMSYLVDVCTFLRDRSRAETLYRMLLPFAGRTVVIGNSAVCYGDLSRYLGALATTLERWNDAARHFENALAMNARMEARPWLAHTQEGYAQMLLMRRRSGDRSKAATLLDASLATARELGMRALEERITAAKAQMKSRSA